jgi:hypothetical protein
MLSIIEFFQHIQNLLMASPIERLIGYFYMLGIIIYILFIGIRHKAEFWEAIRGSDGKLETPELIIMLIIIVYVNLILADTFLGLTPSEGVFWSLDAIILFALTGRVMLNRFGSSKSTEKNEEDNDDEARIA